jgi:hypothetical protein
MMKVKVRCPAQGSAGTRDNCNYYVVIGGHKTIYDNVRLLIADMMDTASAAVC